MGYIKNNNIASFDEDSNLRYCLEWNGESVSYFNYLGDAGNAEMGFCTDGYKYRRNRVSGAIQAVTEEYCEFYCNRDSSFTITLFVFEDSQGNQKECAVSEGVPVTDADWECLRQWCDFSANSRGDCPLGYIEITHKTSREQCFPSRETAQIFKDFWDSTIFTGNDRTLIFRLQPEYNKRIDEMLRDVHSCLCRAIFNKDEAKLRSYIDFLDFERTLMICQMLAIHNCPDLINQVAFPAPSYERCVERETFRCLEERYQELVTDVCS